jgi:FtsP/CotA-like multicopper oxidase with cupredoxin domain
MEEKQKKHSGISRRGFLKYASASAGIVAATLALSKSVSSTLPATGPSVKEQFLHGHPHGVSAPSQVEGGMTPMQFLEDYYKPPKDPVTGERVFELTAAPQAVTVANGVQFPAWVFTAPPPRGPTVPGPTLRVDEGDNVRIRFHNGDEHPHTIHLHGIHPAKDDGVFEIVNVGRDYEYGPFKAEPFGLFPYHCHVMPVKKHIAKGMYGAFIVDPVASPAGAVGVRPPADREFVMVMNGFDADFDDENEFYTVNGIANYYLDYPIRIGVGELVRIYLVNMTEFDAVNSFHLHGNMFRLYRTGTRFDPTATLDGNISRPLDDRIKEWLYLDDFAEVTDTVFLGQGERAILEFIPKTIHRGGRFLFHAHQSEFVELGWTGLFNVV